MNISPDEAHESLGEIHDAADRARKMAAYAGTDTILIAWGLIWAVGFSASHFQATLGGPVSIGVLWLVLVAAGFATTIIVCRRPAVRSPVYKRIFWFWLLLFVYADLWVGLLFPFLHVRGAEQSEMFRKHFWGMLATVPMFGYVVMGLWLENFMIWIGLAVTALTVLGLLLLQPFFCLWMAAVGGGTLLATGLLIRNRWR